MERRRWLQGVMVLALALMTACGRGSAPPSTPTSGAAAAAPTATSPAPSAPAAPGSPTAPPAPTAPPPTASEAAAPTASALPSPTLPAAQPLPAPTLFDGAWESREPFVAGLLDPAQAEALPDATVYHLDLRLAPDLDAFEGQMEVRYTNQEREPLEALHFRLFPNLFGGTATVSEVRVNGEAATPTLALVESDMTVPLPAPLAPGERVVVGMRFAVDVPTSAGGNYGAFVFLDQVLALAHFYPLIPAYDETGWNVEVPPEAGDVVYADSSFYRVRITAPAVLTLATSGHVLARETAGEEQVLTVAAGPVRDFYIAGSPDYEVKQITVDGTTIRSYGLPAYDAANQEVLTYAAQAVETFNRLVGPYPFTEFDLVATPNRALGIEYPGIVAITLRLYDENAQFGGASRDAVLESTVVHEAGHQWFYSTVGNDQLDAPWLDESLVQYITMRFYGERGNPQAMQGFRQSLESRWDRVERQPIPIGLPVRDYEGNAYSAIVYGRGALFFDALAETMGPEPFDAFLKAYYQEHLWGIATTQSLKAMAEQHCGCDLTALFQAWVYPEG